MKKFFVFISTTLFFLCWTMGYSIHSWFNWGILIYIFHCKVFSFTPLFYKQENFFFILPLSTYCLRTPLLIKALISGTGNMRKSRKSTSSFRPCSVCTLWFIVVIIIFFSSRGHHYYRVMRTQGGNRGIFIELRVYHVTAVT